MAKQKGFPIIKTAEQEKAHKAYLESEQKDKCPDCDGTGEVSPFEPYPDAKYPCPTCKGTGEKDRWHIIWDMCSEFITDPADCNELSTNIDSFFEVQKKLDGPDREKIWQLVLDFSYKDITIDEVTDQIIALIEPLIKDAREQENEDICQFLIKQRANLIDVKKIADGSFREEK